MVGVDPAPLTLRQLVWMADGRQRADWSHTSSLMALLAELKRDRRRRSNPFQPSEFNPTVTEAADDAVEMTAAQFAALIGAKLTPLDEG